MYVYIYIDLIPLKNEEMESTLSEKQALIESKEADLNVLKERLTQIESTGLATPEHSVTPTTSTEEPSEFKRELEESQHELNLIKKELEESQEQQKKLREELDQAKSGHDLAISQSKAMEEEKANLIKSQEATEESLRENMEKLREKLETEKQELVSCIREKENEIKKLKNDMDDLRDSIQVS